MPIFLFIFKIFYWDILTEATLLFPSVGGLNEYNFYITQCKTKEKR